MTPADKQLLTDTIGILGRRNPASVYPSSGPPTPIPAPPTSKAADHWDEIPGHPVSDWQEEVGSGDTRLGYQEWVHNRNISRDQVA